MSNPFKKESKRIEKIIDKQGDDVKDEEFAELQRKIDELRTEEYKVRKLVPDKKVDTINKVEPEKTIKVDKQRLEKTHRRIKFSVKKKYLDWNKGLLYLSMLGIMGIIFLYQMVDKVSPVYALVLMLFGMLCFMPLGVLIGKFMLDPYVRCKLMRRMRGKNYGMVYFVHKGGTRVDIRIKNLDDDVIVHGTKLWVLESGGIYYLDRDDVLIRHAIIEPQNVVTSPNNVPILFLDHESMLPLRFWETATKSNPQQVGATTLGYINNQIAKNLFFKRSMQTFYLIILALESICVVGLIMIYDAITKL
jgi:hypothetical protein